jgi:biopolymer transport protein ExbD
VIYLEKEPVVADELIDELQAFKQKNSDTKIVLHADKLVQFKYVAKALDAVSSVDISNFNIAVEKSEE